MRYDAIEAAINIINIEEIKPLARDIGVEIKAAIRSKSWSIRVSKVCSFLSSFFIPIGALVTCMSALWTLVVSIQKTPLIVSSIIASVSFFIGVFSVLNTQFEFRKRLYHTESIYSDIIRCKSRFIAIIALSNADCIEAIAQNLLALQHDLYKSLERKYEKRRGFGQMCDRADASY